MSRREFLIKENQQLKKDFQELENDCRQVASNAAKPNLGAIRPEIIKLTRRVVEDHLSKNEDIGQLLAQSPKSVKSFFKRNPEALRKYANRSSNTTETIPDISNARVPTHEIIPSSSLCSPNDSSTGTESSRNFAAAVASPSRISVPSSESSGQSHSTVLSGWQTHSSSSYMDFDRKEYSRDPVTGRPLVRHHRRLRNGSWDFWPDD